MNKPRLQMLSASLKDFEGSRTRLVMPEGKSSDKFEFQFSTFGRLSPECSTAACAIGMASMLPEFRDQGLYYTVCGRMMFIWARGLNEYESEDTEPDSFLSAALFFDIPLREASRLFDPNYYWNGSMTTALEVAQEIDYYMECQDKGTMYVTNYRRHGEED